MGLSENIRAALLIMASMASFTINDALMKLAAADLPFFEQIFLRGVVISLGLFLYARASGHMTATISSKDRLLSYVRVAAEAIGTVFFLSALYSIPIANLSAILQALPLTVTLAAALFFGETVGWRRIAAILIGFVGVAIIIRPGLDGFTAHSLYGVATVIAVTIRDMASRKLSADVPSSRIALMSAVGVTLFAGGGSMVLQEHWVATNAIETLLIFGAAVSLMIGYVTAVSGMRSGEIGFVAPFRYTSLLVALILGFVLFNEWPDALTMLGASIVVATGLFTIYREQKTSQSPAAVDS